jgi:ABC-type multidrug transport system fused ATPase/permease subunit
VNDTIASNIALGVTKENIDKNKLKKAVKSAQISDFINELPLKLETLIGERGVNLSGGQKQRIALARAFYFEKNILIFDEATSSLDYKTENQIIDQIQSLKKDKTIIIISHRHETIKFVDKVYSLNNGKILEKKSYE